MPMSSSTTTRMFGGVTVADFNRDESACSEVATSDDITAQSAMDREDAIAPRNNFFVELCIVRTENLRADGTIGAQRVCSRFNLTQDKRDPNARIAD